MYLYIFCIICFFEILIFKFLGVFYRYLFLYFEFLEEKKRKENKLIFYFL